jgi:hypothetical protein
MERLRPGWPNRPKERRSRPSRPPRGTASPPVATRFKSGASGNPAGRRLLLAEARTAPALRRLSAFFCVAQKRT